MIAKVKTENGENWAIVLDKHSSLEDITNYTNGIITIMKYATYCNDILPNDKICNMLLLLEHMMPTINQVTQYEQFLKKGK